MMLTKYVLSDGKKNTSALYICNIFPVIIILKKTRNWAILGSSSHMTLVTAVVGRHMTFGTVTGVHHMIPFTVFNECHVTCPMNLDLGAGTREGCRACTLLLFPELVQIFETSPHCQAHVDESVILDAGVMGEQVLASAEKHQQLGEK